jgi:hypothetical protein
MAINYKFIDYAGSAAQEARELSRTVEDPAIVDALGKLADSVDYLRNIASELAVAVGRGKVGEGINYDDI